MKWDEYGKTCDEVDEKLSECSVDSSDEYVRGVQFDDSEEEKMKGFDESVRGVHFDSSDESVRGVHFDSGMPKKLRKRELDEVNQTKWKRTNTSHRCKTCYELGHNNRTCKKNKQIVLVPSGNTIEDLPRYELPTQASQTSQVHLAPQKGDDDVLDIQPLSVDTSPINPSESKSSGVRVFFGKKPKVCKNKPFKPRGLYSPKPSCSEPESIKTCSVSKSWADICKRLTQ
ncbi:unnamed protein product [Vicia faba]|uniref:Uncharacterized protein n=1 Tax=Vicia faba TaxID=3906 RepID=A0AAV0ZA06_VICFA|nr:unnamed protein product [Vicia faba]